MDKRLLTLLIIIVSASVMYLISGYSQNNTIACTSEARICPDGSSVGRIGPSCEFTPCPTIVKTIDQDKFCGGIAAIECPKGFLCQPQGKYPDAGGTCIKIPPGPKDKIY